MKMIMILAAATLSIAELAGARGADDKNAATPRELTVGDVINVMSGINSLDTHQTGVVDKNGNAVTAPNDFYFSGAMHLALARDSAKGVVVFKAYQDAVTKLRIQIAGPSKDVPKDRLDDFNEQTSKMLEAPADVKMIRVKEGDLCLDKAPPACPDKNNIPITTLSLIDPIVDH